MKIFAPAANRSVRQSRTGVVVASDDLRDARQASDGNRSRLMSVVTVTEDGLVPGTSRGPLRRPFGGHTADSCPPGLGGQRNA